MRYTTAIDISDVPELYRNKQIVLLYFHLCLRSGYHADDRDLYHRSFRVLSSEVGITLSACRHALKVLHSHGLVSFPSPGVIAVKKWVSPLPIPKREVVHQSEDLPVETADEREARQMYDTERRLRGQLDGTPQTHEILMLFLYDKANKGNEEARMEADAIRAELEKVGYHSKWL